MTVQSMVSMDREIYTPPRGVCYQYRDSGWCSYGDRCRFEHGSSNSAQGPPNQGPSHLGTGATLQPQRPTPAPVSHAPSSGRPHYPPSPFPLPYGPVDAPVQYPAPPHWQAPPPIVTPPPMMYMQSPQSSWYRSGQALHTMDRPMAGGGWICHYQGGQINGQHMH